VANVRVLIVDDTDTWRMLVAQYLRNFEGIELVGQGESGAEAIRKCKELKPDVVLLDISLPDGKGVDIARQIKEFDKTIKVYLYSAYEVGEIRELAIDSPADGFIQKSALKTELLTVLKHEVEARRSATAH